MCFQKSGLSQLILQQSFYLKHLKALNKYFWKYRIRLGGGGPGMDTPPERLVTTGPFAYCRNPMYLGHIIFLLGLTLSLGSMLAAIITAASVVWFQFRVRRDEKRLAERFGQSYVDYAARVGRWVPGLP